MHVLITGANGQLGRCLQNVLAPTPYRITAVDLAGLDITNSVEVSTRIARIAPDVVVNAAAYTAVDQAESDAARAGQVNAQGPKFLARACREHSIPLVHVSTDYVFDGNKIGAYQPGDATGPTGVYGQTKLDGETAVMESGVDYLIVRTAWVFSEYGNNFVKTMLRLGAERDSLGVVSDQSGSPTYAGDLAAAIVQALPKLTAGQGLGLYHYAGEPPCTWYAFAERIFSQAHTLGLLASRPALSPITSDQYPTRARRPLNSVLDSSAFTAAFGVPPSDWKQAVTTVLERLRTA